MPIILTGNQSLSGNIIIRDKLILDDFPQPLFAFGHEKYQNSYTGLYARIRRSSDSAEADFGWKGNQPDWASIVKFVGVGNTIYLTRLYNQGSFGGYVEQNTTGYQPIVTLSDPIKSLPATLFNTTFMAKNIGNPSSILTNDFHFFTAFNILSYFYNNDAYCVIQPVTGGTRAMSHYYSNYESARLDKCIVKASGSWATDYFSVGPLHNLNTNVSISHKRSGTHMYGSKNGTQFVDLTGSAGPLEWADDSYLQYNSMQIGENDAHQYSFCQILFGEALSSKYETRLTDYLVAKYV